MSSTGPSIYATNRMDFLPTASHRSAVIEEDGTSNEKYDQKFVNRIFSCLVTFPLRRPINGFESILEFLEACRDVVQALRSRYQDGKILYRDICIKNLTITSPRSARDAKGVLINLDLALDLEREPARKGEMVHLEGSMAIGLLSGDPNTYCLFSTSSCG